MNLNLGKIKARCEVVDGCWVWSGYFERGHARMRHGTAKNAIVARVLYEDVHGIALDRTDAIKQVCGNERCCNPEHLYAEGERFPKPTASSQPRSCSRLRRSQQATAEQDESAGALSAQSYETFVERKLTYAPSTGVEDALVEHPNLFDFQNALTSWALRRGRAAIFADTGLGKARMELEWSARVADHANGPALILTPLAVAPQFLDEGAKIGLTGRVFVVREQSEVDLLIATHGAKLVFVTNYERLHKFETDRFVGVSLDESSILKDFSSKTRARLIEAFARTPFRLCATATPSPNDYTELGNHAEFLGVCTHAEMLSEFFVHDGGETQKWRLKGHARQAFWRWVANWAAMVRSPADLGFDASLYQLPPLTVEHVKIAADHEQVRQAGTLFALPASTLMERRKAKKDSVGARVAACAELVCQTNGSANGARATSSASTTNAPQCFASEDSAVSHAPSGTLAPAASKTPTNQERENYDISLSTTESIQKNTSALLSDRPSITPSGDSGTLKTKNSGSGSGRRSETGLNATLTNTKTSVSSTTSESHSTTTRECSQSKAEAAPSAAQSIAQTLTREADAIAGCTSITIMSPDKLEDCSVISAISDSESSQTRQIDCAQQWIIWCELNHEQEALAKLLGNECASIYGTLEPDEKIARYQRWLRGEARVLLTKPSMFGMGCNMQQCHLMAFVGVSDSWERYYQSVRRIWRFGQKYPCNVFIFASELEGEVVANLRRKEADAKAMADELSRETRDAVFEAVRGTTRTVNPYQPSAPMCIPDWLRSA